MGATKRPNPATTTAMMPTAFEVAIGRRSSPVTARKTDARASDGSPRLAASQP
jgi:hypothetical protein